MGKIYGDDYNAKYNKWVKTGTAVSLIGFFVGGISKKIAQKNQKEAQSIINDAQKRYNFAVEDLNSVVRTTRNTVMKVISLKKKIMKNNMKKFIKAYKRLAPQITLQDSQGIYELRRFAFSSEEFDYMQKERQVYLSYNEHRLGDKAFEVALLMVQDGTVSNLVECMNTCLEAKNLKDTDLKKSVIDNAKIQSIGDIAKIGTTAIMFGMSGISDAIASVSCIDDAKSFDAECTKEIEMIKIKRERIQAISDYAYIHLELLERFEALLNEYVKRAVKIIKSKDNFFHYGRIKEEKFTQEEIEILAFTLSLIGAVKTVIDSPIISKEGDVFDDQNSEFKSVQESVEIFEKKCIEMRD